MKKIILIPVLALLFSFPALSDESGIKRDLSGAISWQNSPLRTSLKGVYDKSVDVQYAWRDNAIKLVLLARPFLHTQDGEIYGSDIEGFEEKYYYHVGLEYLHFAKAGKKTQFYGGGGPALHINKKRAQGNKKKLDSYNYGAALAIRFGVEFRLHSNVCLRFDYLSIVQFGINVSDYYLTGDYVDWTLAPYSARVASFDSFPQMGFAFYF